MRAGEFPDGAKVLRAKIDMASPNIHLRDPVMYRILHAEHHRTGDKWCIYPMYDWAHGLEDSLEGITHSICTLEFEDHRPLYDWFLEQLGVYRPQQIEFARLQPDLHGDEQAQAARSWCRTASSTAGTTRACPPSAACAAAATPPGDPRLLRPHRRDQGRQHRRPRAAGALPARGAEHVGAARDGGAGPAQARHRRTTPRARSSRSTCLNNPEDAVARATREVPFSRELYIERDDFLEDPPKKFFRLAPGREVRLTHAYFVDLRRAS